MVHAVLQVGTQLWTTVFCAILITDPKSTPAFGCQSPQNRPTLENKPTPSEVVESALTYLCHSICGYGKKH